MYLFQNDYNQICHPAILQRMMNESQFQVNGYGIDPYCDNAAKIIRTLCNKEDAEVHFLVGGTQTNVTIIDTSLRPYQAAVGPVTAHINVHETGAVEATGHKILGIPSTDGKITAEQIENVVRSHNEGDSKEHEVQPKLVYISNSTELGTIYYKKELEEISQVCHDYGLYLFIDGARLGYALTAPDNDVSLQDLARLADVFYIGGTKLGAMFGEAVVICNPKIGEDFRYMIKRHGGMLAKGWLLGLQFQVLMENDLYFSIAKHANDLAERIRRQLQVLGYPLRVKNTTNQIFAVFPDPVLRVLERNFSFSDLQRVDDTHCSVRLCTSWATTSESVDALCDELKRLSK